MRRFYRMVGERLKNYLWGRQLVNHVVRHQRLYENFEALYTALILALLIKAFLFEAYKIPSSSMHSTLLENDRIFVNKFQYGIWDVAVGDVIVFRTRGIDKIDHPDKPYYIKRVVGLPGDEIAIRDGYLYRNGERITEPDIFKENYYVPMQFNQRRVFRVPDGEVLVFGDNSFNSFDSREWGGVPYENIMGKAFFRYWPLSRIGTIPGVAPERAIGMREAE